MTRRRPKELNLSKELVLQRRQEKKLNHIKFQLRKQKRIGERMEERLQQNKTSMTLRFSVNEKENFERKSKSNQINVQYNKKKSKIYIETTINIPLLNHLDWFWYKLKTEQFPFDLMKELFPNFKEVSESVSAIRTLLKITNLKKNPQTILSIGDGIKPRTGSLFALCSDPQSYIASIDPILRPMEKNTLSNLFLYPLKIEDWLNQNEDIIKAECNQLIVSCVHSHAKFNNYMPKLFSLIKPNTKVIIYAMKCCGVQQSFTKEELQLYQLEEHVNELDWNCFSPCRNYIVWKSK